MGLIWDEEPLIWDEEDELVYRGVEGLGEGDLVSLVVYWGSSDGEETERY